MSKKQNTETHKKSNEGVTIFTPIEAGKKEKKNIFATKDVSATMSKNTSQFLNKNYVTHDTLVDTKPVHKIMNILTKELITIYNVKMLYKDEEILELAVGTLVVKQKCFFFIRPGLVNPLLYFNINTVHFILDNESIEFEYNGIIYFIKNVESIKTLFTILNDIQNN